MKLPWNQHEDIMVTPCCHHNISVIIVRECLSKEQQIRVDSNVALAGPGLYANVDLCQLTTGKYVIVER